MVLTKHKSAIIIVILIVGSIIAVLISNRRHEPGESSQNARADSGQIISGSFDESKFKTDEEWKEILTPKEYHILREAGTEIPFTGKLDKEERIGTYVSVGCETPVFRSEQKYDSGTGWPSFWAPIDSDAVVLRLEQGLGETRVEVLDKCGGHLGHVFDDGPPPTGKRYCMNSEALKFIPDEE